MKIGIAQINTTIGDHSGNTDLIVDSYNKLVQDGADIVVFPELALNGYCPRDLIYKDHFVEDSHRHITTIAKSITDVPAAIGFLERAPENASRRQFNSLAWCQKGKILHTSQKCLLPTYDIFEESHYFLKGAQPLIVGHKDKKIALTICEDIWTGQGQRSHRDDRLDPVEFIQGQNVDVILNLSASPWHFRKEAKRNKQIASVANRANAPLVYCNLVGANDEIIFDGQSLAADAQGEIFAKLPQFEEFLAVVDIENKEHSLNIPSLETIPSIYEALKLGLRDYAHKIGFKKAVIGLSGGIDSTVVAAIAADALGAENIFGYALPSKISSEHSVTDAKALADNLNINFDILPIHNIVEAIEETLAPIIKGTKRDTTEENIQARTRGILLMAAANKFGALLLSTGNKSELAVGYCTLYGDMAGGLGIISDVSKMNVYALARYINEKHNTNVIPESIINKPPSAELSPDQLDSDSLPPYDMLDTIVCSYIEDHHSAEEIMKLTQFDPQTVRDIVRKIDLNEYKRKQAPPGLKITPRAFGIGRRMPIVQKYFS